MIKFQYIFLIVTVLGSSLSAFSQRRKKDKETDIKEQALDDLNAFTKDDFPYIERFFEALRLKMSGNTSEAKSLLKECLQEKPTDDAVLYSLAQISLSEGMKNEALSYFERASSSDPSNFHYIKEIAQLQFEQANFEASAKNYKKLADKEPRDAELQYSYAQTLLYTRNYEEALTTFNRIESLMGPIPEITFTKIDLLTELQREGEIDAEIDALRKAFPNDQDILGAVVQFYEKKGEKAKVIAILEEDVKTNPSNVNAQVILAEHYIVTKQNDKFLSSFEALMADKDANPEGKASLLQTASSIGVIDNKRALQEVNKLEESIESNPELRMILADIQLQNGDVKGGLENFRESLKAKGNDYVLWRNLLTSELKYGFYQYLKEDATTAIESYPNLPEFYAFAALGNLHQGNRDEAKALLEVGEEYIISDENGSLTAVFNMVKAKIAFAKKDYKSGNAFFQKSVNATTANEPFLAEWSNQMALANVGIDAAWKRYQNLSLDIRKNVNVMLIEARLQYRRNELTKANELLTLILKEIPNYANALDLMGDVLIAQGKTDEAVLSWKEAKKFNTSNKNIDKKIETRKIHDPKFY